MIVLAIIVLGLIALPLDAWLLYRLFVTLGHRQTGGAGWRYSVAQLIGHFVDGVDVEAVYRSDERRVTVCDPRPSEGSAPAGAKRPSGARAEASKVAVSERGAL